MSNFQVRFSDLCQKNPLKGYALDTPYSILFPTFTPIDAAVEKVHKEVNCCIQFIELFTGRKIVNFSIRKSYIRQGSLYHSGTWVHPLGCYYRNFSNIDGLVVLSAVNNDIPICNGHIIMNYAEEYTLQLRNGVIGKFRDNCDKRITSKTSPGARDGGISAGYMVYMTYTFEVR